MWYENIVEKNLVPDTAIRMVIRRLLKARLRNETFSDIEKQQDFLQSFIDELKQKPIAVNTEEANEQHYEVPALFFKHVLGPHMKYSCNYWSGEASSNSYQEGLADAEKAMLDLTLQRADLADGQTILELGC